MNINNNSAHFLINELVKLYDNIYREKVEKIEDLPNPAHFNSIWNEKNIFIPLYMKIRDIYLNTIKEMLSSNLSIKHNVLLLRFLRRFTIEGGQDQLLDQYTKTLNKHLKISNKIVNISYFLTNRKEFIDLPSVPLQAFYIEKEKTIIDILTPWMSYYYFSDHSKVYRDLLDCVSSIISEYNLFDPYVTETLNRGKKFAYALSQPEREVFVDVFQETVQKLPLNQSALLVAGYFCGARFPIFIEITKTDNLHLDIKIFNIHQQATDYHSFSEIGGKKFICPYITLKQIKIADFTNINFIRSYYEIFHETKYEIEIFYNLIFAALKPDIICREPIKTSDMVEQTIYSSPWLTLHAFLKTKSQNENQLNTLQILLKSKLLQYLMQIPFDEKEMGNILVPLLRSCIASISQEVLNYLNLNNPLSPLLKETHENLQKFNFLVNEIEIALAKEPIVHCRVSRQFLLKRNPNLGVLKNGLTESKPSVPPINYFYKCFPQNLANNLFLSASFLISQMQIEKELIQSQPNQTEAPKKLDILARGHLDIIFEAWSENLENNETALHRIDDPETFKESIKDLVEFASFIFYLKREKTDPVLETYVYYVIILIFELCQQSNFQVDEDKTITFKELFKNNFLFIDYSRHIEGKSEKSQLTNQNIYFAFHKKLQARIINFCTKQNNGFEKHVEHLKLVLDNLPNLLILTAAAREHPEQLEGLMHYIQQVSEFIKSKNWFEAEQELQSLKNEIGYLKDSLQNFSFIRDTIKKLNIFNHSFICMPKPYQDFLPIHDALKLVRREKNDCGESDYEATRIKLPRGLSQANDSSLPIEMRLLFKLFTELEEIREKKSPEDLAEQDSFGSCKDEFERFLAVLNSHSTKTVFGNLRLCMAIANGMYNNRAPTRKSRNFIFVAQQPFCESNSKIDKNIQFVACSKSLDLNYGDLTDENLVLLVKEARRGLSENNILIRNFSPAIQKAIIDNKIKEDKVVELLQLMSRNDIDNGNPHLELQVIKTLSYFSARLELLTDTQMQAFFKLLFFENNYLEINLNNNLYFNDKIQAFFQKSFDYFLKNSQFLAAAYILELERLYALRINENKEIFIDLTLSKQRERIKKIVKTHTISKEDKYLFILHLVASYLLCPLDNFNQEDAIWLVKGLIYYQNYSLEEQLSQETIQQVMFARLKFREKVAEHFNNNPSFSCREVFNEFFEGIQINNWRMQNEFKAQGISTDSSEWFINIESGVIYQSEFRITDLMSTLLKLPNFPKNLGDLNTYVRLIEDNKYEFIDLKGSIVRVYYNAYCNELRIYRQFDPLDEAAKGEYLLALESESLYLAISSSSIPNAIRSLIVKHKVWINDKYNYLLLTDEDYNPKYLMKLLTSANVLLSGADAHILECRSLSERHLTLGGIYNENLITLPFKHNDTLLWVNKENKNQLVKIEIPKFNLAFEVKPFPESFKLYSLTLPGYRIVANQRIRHLTLSNLEYWIVKNEIGDYKIFIAYTPPPNTQKKVSAENSKKLPPLLVYDMDKNRNIIPNNNLQKIYLAYLYLLQKKHQKALELLRSVNLSSRRNSNQDRTLELELLDGLKCFTDKIYFENSVIYLKIIILLRTPEIDLNHLYCYQSYRQSNLILNLTIEEEEFLSQLTKPCILQKQSNASSSTSEIQANRIRLSHRSIDTERGHLRKDLKHALNKIRVILRKAIKDFQNYLNIAVNLPLDAIESRKNKFLVSALSVAPTKHSLLNPSIMFFEQFLYYYDLAKKQEKSLEWLLKFWLNNESVPKSLIFILDKVRKNPEKYPTPQEILQVLLNMEFSNDIKASHRNFYSMWFNDDEELCADEDIEIQPSINFSMGALQPFAPSNPIQPLNCISRDPLTFSTIKPNNRILFEPNELKQFGFYSEEKPNPLSLSVEEINSLAEIYSSHSATPQNKELAKEISNYWKGIEPLKVQHMISHDHLNTLKEHLFLKEMDLERSIYEKTKKLLNFVNHCSTSGATGLFILQLKELAMQSSEITFDDLCIVAARSSCYSLSNANSALQQFEKAILIQTIDILTNHTMVQQIERARRLLAKLEKIKENPEDHARIAEQLYQEIIRVPRYNPYEDPQFALFEYKTGFGLYAEQIEDLKQLIQAMVSHQNKELVMLLQKAMGSGKTKVYLCLLAQMLADKNYLPIIVIPEAQYQIVFEVLEFQSNYIFKQTISELSFNDENLSSLEGLNQLYKQLKDVHKRKNFFITTDSDLHKFNTAYKKKWYDCLRNPQDVANVQALEVLKKIKKFLFKQGLPIYDEADTIYDCLRQYILAAGKPESILHEHSEFVADLFAAIEKPLAEMKPFNCELYEQNKEVLIYRFISEYVKTKWPELYKEEQSLKVIENYLKNQEHSQIALYNSIDKQNVSEKVKQNQKNLLAIALQIFTDLIPLTKKKVYGEDYGFPIPSNDLENLSLKKMSKAFECFNNKVIGPYSFNNKPKDASFSFFYTNLILLLQAVQAGGITVWMLHFAISDLQKRAHIEMQEDGSLSLHDTQAYKDFEKLCGGVEMPFYKYKRDSLEKLKEFYISKKDLIRKFTVDYFFSRVTEHRLLFQSSPHNLKSISEKSIWFTGTAWNTATWDEAEIKLDSTECEVLGLIYKRNKQFYQIPDLIDISQTIAEIKKLDEKIGGSFHAFIDTGALFNGIDNKIVAQEFLKFYPHIEGVVFAGKDDKLYILERNNNSQEILYAASSIPAENTFFYLDQARATGTDLPIGGKKLPEDEIYSIISVGPNTKTRDFLQGYKRERNKNHRVEIICPKSTVEMLCVDLNVEDCNLDNLLIFLRNNQNKSLSDQMELSLRGRMLNVLYQYLLKLLDDFEPKQIAHSGEYIQNLIADFQEDAPAKIMGATRHKMNKEEVFNILCNEMLKKINPLCDIFPGILNREKIAEDLKKCIRPDLFPDQMKSASQDLHILGQSQIESQQQQQQQQQQEVSAFNQIFNLNYNHVIIPAQHWRWGKPEDITQPEFYRFINQLQEIREIYCQSQLPSNVIETSLEAKVYPSENVPLFLLNTILPFKYEEIEKNIIFDNNIYSSWNFENFGYQIMSMDISVCRKEVKQVLILINPATQNSNLILIDQSDAGYFNEHLAQVKECAKLTIALYDLNLGVIQSNNSYWLDPNTKQEFLAQKGIVRLILQAKIFGGHLSFNKEEMKELENLCQEKGVEPIRKFIEYVLRTNDEKKKYYAHSKLKKLLYAQD